MKLGLLVMTPGKQEGKLIEIKPAQFLVGRDPQCHLRPASPLISKRHCALIQRDGKVFIRDFDSTNGTFVNGEPVKGERELHNDDQLKFGPMLFAVRLEKSAAAPSRTPVPPTKPATTMKTPAPPTRAAANTPPPATVHKPAAGKGASSEDDVAAMLLSLEGEDGPATESGESLRVPEGSTELDIKAPPEQPAAPAKAKAPTGDTQSAAASILEKMWKRPRG